MLLFFSLPFSASLAFAEEADPLEALQEPGLEQIAERHRELMERRSAGRGASPIFRDPWTRLEVHWALVEAGQEGLHLDLDEQARARDLMLLAAGMASEDLLREIAQQSPAMQAIERFADSLIQPSVSMDRGGKAQRGGASRSNSSDRLERQEDLDLQALQVERYRAAPPLRVSMFNGVMMRSDPEDPEAFASWALSATAMARLQLADSRWTFYRDLASWEPGAEEPLQGRWQFRFRQPLIEPWSVSLSTMGDNGNPQPQSMVTALSRRLPQRPGWLLQLTSIWDWPEESLSPWREPTPMLRVRYAGGWRSPWVESSRYPS